MDIFKKITDEPIDPVDPELRVVRHAYRLLDQYGFSTYEHIDVESGDFLDPDDDLENAQSYHYLETYCIDTIDPRFAFCFDSVPQNSDGLPVLEPGFSALHMFVYNDEEEPEEVEQIAFRQEIHPLGFAILKGYEFEVVNDPAEILEIGQGLYVLEERLWHDLVSNEHSHMHRYPESEVMNGFAGILENAVDE